MPARECVYFYLHFAFGARNKDIAPLSGTDAPPDGRAARLSMLPPARRHPCLYALMCAPARARRQTENDRTPRMYKPREEPRGRKTGIATVGRAGDQWSPLQGNGETMTVRAGYCVTMLPLTLCSGGGAVPRRRLVGATIGRPGKVNNKWQNRRRSRATNGRPYRQRFS